MSEYLLIAGVATGIFAALVQVLDAISTRKVLEAGGRELNPWIAWLQERWPRTWVVVKYAIGALLFALPIYWPLPAVILPILALSLVNGYFVIRNFRVLRRMKAKQSQP